jgi:intein/homing endonuclease
VTPELAEFVGLVTGDGSLNEKKLEFHNSCDAVRERYKTLLDQFNLPYREFESHSTTVVQSTCRVLSRAIHDVFDLPFGKKSGTVTVPEPVLRSPDHVVAAFLRGYFDADGYVSGEKREIELTTASKEMMEQVRHALLRFGITCYTKRKTVDDTEYYRVFIRGAFVEDFAEHIGSHHPEKSARLASIRETETMDNTNIDVIPEGGRFLRELRSRLRISPTEQRDATGKDYWSYENEEYRVTWHWFQRLVQYYRSRFASLKDMEEQVELLRRFVEKDHGKQVQKIRTLRDLLGISYATLGAETGMTEGGMRNMLKNGDAPDLNTVNRINTLIDAVEDRLAQFKEA